ncbi:MAG: Wzt carbohydrate-binding domain-containing protein, partial [Spirochaetes bacterium]|nr:Wzt carbohydrate-binding domain-containing protein [Spirochaetota bacterium]
QKKCLGKMGEVAKEGRTVLFVSHNMGAVTNLCSWALLLNNGQILQTGLPEEVVSIYFDCMAGRSKGEVLLTASPSEAYFTRIAILNHHNQPMQAIPVASDFVVLLEYNVERQISALEVSFSLFNSNGSKVFYSALSKSRNRDSSVQNHEPGHYVAKVNIPGEFIAPGTYFLTVGLHQPNVRLFDRRDHVIEFRVVETGFSDYRYADQNIGSILVQFDWIVEHKNNGAS